MRRLISVLCVMALMAALMVVLAMPAFAAKPTPAPGCTFAKGTTTCVETELLEATTVSVRVGTGCLDYRRETFGETTTTYRGQSDTVANTTYRIYQTDRLIGTSQNC